MIYSSHNWTPVSHIRNSIQRAYEPVQIYFFTCLASLMGAKCFLDIGSNVGTFSVAMADVETIENIHAFEPMPLLHAQLTQNLVLNDPREKATAHNIALSDQMGAAEFSVISDFSGANGIASTSSHTRGLVDRTITVSTSTLDGMAGAVVIPNEGPIFVKIDVEGHELQVLTGSRDFLRNDCVLQVEVLGGGGEGSAPVIDALVELGYEKFWQIGADYYFCKPSRAPSQDYLLQAISTAHSDMIRDFRTLGPFDPSDSMSARTGRISRDFGPVQIRVYDPLSRWLRRALKRD